MTSTEGMIREGFEGSEKDDGRRKPGNVSGRIEGAFGKMKGLVRPREKRR